MVENQKKRKNAFMILGVSLILVLAIALSITLAWFTDKDSASGTIKFGTIDINITETASKQDFAVKTLSGSVSYDKMLPGDDFEISFKYQNVGEAVYAIADIVLTATDAEDQETTFPMTSGLYTLTTQTVTSYTEPTAPTAIEGNQQNATEVKITTELPTSIGDEFQNASVTVELTIYAIQQRNFETPAAALAELKTLMA